jgi:hypothetical protein
MSLEERKTSGSMNVRRAALLLLPAVLLVGAFLAVGGHGAAEAAKAPATCGFLFADSFADDSRGWTFGPEWEIGPASESSGHEIGYPDPAFDHTSGSDNGVAGVVIGGNATTDLHPYWYITSPTINAAGNYDLVGLVFWRWLNSDFAPNMVNTVEVYYAGNWITLWTSGGAPGITEDQWTRQGYNLTPYRSAQNLRFRIGHSVGSAGAHVVSSWNIDDLAVLACWGPPPAPPPPRPPPAPTGP